MPGSARQSHTQTADSESQVAEIFRRLSEPFEVTFHDARGGVNLTYVTGEQVVRRLNEVLGVTGWSFSVINHGINSEADEAWVLGELVVFTHAATPLLLALVPPEQRPGIILVRRQQFGSQKLKRSRKDKSIMDIGFDFKGAATDALKKCASQVGVGLYLMARAGGTPIESREESDDTEEFFCHQDGCGREILSKAFANGETWSVMDIVQKSRAINQDQPLCFSHLKERLAPGPNPELNGAKKGAHA